MKSHGKNIKIALFLFFLLFLPLAVFYASSEKLQELRSRAASTIGEGGCSEDQILYQNYNIIVRGISSCPKKRIILDALFTLYSQPGFRQKIGNAPLKISNIQSNSENMAYTSNKSLVKLYRFENRGTQEEWKFVITHEMFHLLTQRNKSVLKNYDLNRLSRSDSKCFERTSGAGSGLYLKTYAKKPANAKAESFAESGALYIFDKSPLRPGLIKSFRTECPRSYQWFRENIFTN